MRKVLAASVIAVAVLAACSDKVSFQTVETARLQATENAVYNAQNWRAVQYPDWIIVARGDSTQTQECPMGDGVASIDLVNPTQRTQVIKLKCSTVSVQGCMTDTDFKSRAHLASKENHCQRDIPHPLPKLGK